MRIALAGPPQGNIRAVIILVLASALAATGWAQAPKAAGGKRKGACL